METQQHVFGKSAESRKFKGEQAGAKEGEENLEGSAWRVCGKKCPSCTVPTFDLNLPQRIGFTRYHGSLCSSPFPWEENRIWAAQVMI